MKTAVILGRFQGSHFHPGYKALFEHSLEYDQVIVILGKSHRPCTKTDPLPIFVRKNLIKSFFEKVPQKVTILEIHDEKSDRVWVRKLDSILESQGLTKDTFEFVAGRDSFDSYYHAAGGKFPNNFKMIAAVGEESSTMTREQIKSINEVDRISTSSVRAFAQGVIYATQQPFNRIDPVVDIITIIRRPDKTFKVLLGQKPGEELYQFPGGFVDSTDKTVLLAAKRELEEETSIQAPPTLFTLIGNAFIPNWRYRKGSDRLMSSIYLCTIDFPNNLGAGFIIKDMKAADDLEDVRLFDLPNLNEESLRSVLKPLLLEEHYPILNVLCDNVDILQSKFPDNEESFGNLSKGTAD